MSTALQAIDQAKNCRVLNRLEADLALTAQEQPERRVLMPVEHFILGGMYVRTIFMPAGTLLTSAIHRIEHDYFVSKGRVEVWSEAKGWELIEAPFHGHTLPGTRRGLHTLESTVWTTFHTTDKLSVEEALADIIEPHDSPVDNPSYKEGLKGLLP